MGDIANLSPKDIADWFRLQADKFAEMANTVEHAFKVPPVSPHKTPETPQEAAAPLSGSITAEQLEKRIIKKRARIKDIAREFNVSTLDVWTLVKDPANRVYKGAKGWLDVKSVKAHAAQPDSKI